MTRIKGRSVALMLCLLLTKTAMTAQNAAETTVRNNDMARFETTVTDSTATAAKRENTSEKPMPKRGFLNRLIAYFAESNKEKNHRNFDFSILGGPHYDTDTKLGLGIIAAGLYYSDSRDSLMPPSNVSIYADVSTVGFYMAGIKGVHLFPHQRYRLTYDGSFVFFPTKFWGVGYDMGNKGSNEGKMNRSEVDLRSAFLFRLGTNVFLGPALSFNWMNATHLTRPELLAAEPLHAADIGVGISFELDTRDVMTAPHKGVYLTLSQLLRRRLHNPRNTFHTTTFSVGAYTPAWTGATIAMQAGGVLQFGQLAWNSMALLGNSRTMRGYYAGRYRDNNKLEAQVELRQHIYRRNGAVAWLGAGTVFPKFSKLRMRQVLPNWGIGYRWEFKKNVNIRLDYGFGKSGQSGFMFNVNEAF